MTRGPHALPFDDEPTSHAPMTVTELTAHLKELVETGFGQIAVVGEISNCKQWSSGHLYFTLKDDAAQLRAVMFRTSVRLLRFKPEDGQRVVARGRLSVYEIKGEYQIVCDAIEPDGVGALQLAFEQLKKRLERDGLFDAARKRPLPALPRRIAVVTSGDGAALRDILRVLRTRHPGARIVVRPARVQGEGAAEDLVRALAAIARVPEVDVVIIGRGGGSTEDLWAFNDEALARAIANCPVPVISAVGHETDFTIADFVADVRAATPSNAAEIVVERADHMRTRIARAEERLQTAVSMLVGTRGQRAERLASLLEQWPTTVVLRDRDCDELALRLRHAAADRVSRANQRFEELRRRLERRDMRRVSAELRVRLVRSDARLAQLAAARHASAEAQVREAAARLHALSPLAVLGRGYAVCWNDARTGIIRSVQKVKAGDHVHVTVADGDLACEVQKTTRSRTTPQ
jgi:exodeoxyribonuclease VII large subunit